MGNITSTRHNLCIPVANKMSVRMNPINVTITGMTKIAKRDLELLIFLKQPVGLFRKKHLKLHTTIFNLCLVNHVLTCG